MKLLFQITFFMEGLVIKNIIQKVIRSIELEGDPASYSVDYIVNDRNIAKYKHTVNDSELVRAIEAIDKNNTRIEQHGSKKLTYVEGMISVKVGYNVSKFKSIIKNNGILVLKHCQWIDGNAGKKDKKTGKPLKPKFKLVQCLDSNNKPIEERFKRVIVGSNHNRVKKALFIREDLFEKLNRILLGGIDEINKRFGKKNHYPLYNKGYAKWSAYYGLPSTDSKVVSYVPNIVVIDDFEREASDTFDIVYQKKSINQKWKENDDIKDKYIKNYSVKNGVEKTCKILPFDGAGLVSVECAEAWAKELQIENKFGQPYIPAAFQIRVIPGIKGNLYTFDIKEFSKYNGWIITDIKGKQHDLRTEKVDIILTKSQTKFLDLFDYDIEIWREIFDEEIVWYKENEDGSLTDEIECTYKRTFNISEYSEDLCDLKARMLTAYQHLQTIENTDEEINGITKDTVAMLRKISTDVNEFLAFRSCTDEEESKTTMKEWKRIPPYYRAAYYASEVNKPIIFADKYFQNKLSEDIKGIINRALSGKLYITGNYQVLTPDIYALAQFAFGKRDDEVTGLLKAEEIYSAWWISKHDNAIQKDKTDESFACDKLALIRNPHIYMEARVASMVSYTDERYKEVRKWFKYQRTGIVTDSYSTIPLALGTADFDGDHIATTNSKEYIIAVEQARKEGNGNTVDICQNDETGEEKSGSKIEVDISNVQKLMEFDALAYQNNIGSVIDRVTMLWGIEKENLNNEMIREYIKIMDIVGQLTIDAAKSGEFEAIPSNIEDFIKKNKILKPYFMKYLQKNEQKRKREKNAVENAKIFFDNPDTINNQLLFSSDNTNLNRICKHLEKEIESIKTDVSKNAFDAEKFLTIFTTERPNETSKLYISLRDVMEELTNQHSKLYNELISDDNSESQEDKVSHYKYFYINARAEFLNICKLTEEKSLNKVLNCLVYICYIEKKFFDNDNAKNILWNCFEDEMIARAKEDFTDKDINYSDIEVRVNKTRNLKKRKLSKYLNEKSLCMAELESKDKQYNPIIIRQEEIDLINETISAKMLASKNIKKECINDLKSLYSVLMIISKRLETDRITGKSKTLAHIINSFAIRENSNNHINYVGIAKLCNYNDYQRKNIKQRLHELNMLGAISVRPKDMGKISLKVLYDKIDISENIDSSLVSTSDYKIACERMLKLIGVA